MFQQARFRLTAWYLLIIMAISIAFSVAIYVGTAREFDRISREEEMRLEHPEVHLREVSGNVFEVQPVQLPPSTAPQVINAARSRVLSGLIGINAIILVISALAGYFLAGRTLRPIKKMVDEQNRFITDASHELNTPLTALKTTIEVGLRNKKMSLENAKNILKSNLEEIDTLQNLSEELMTISQLEKPLPQALMEKILLTSAIEKARERVDSLAKIKNISISINVPKVFVMANFKSLTELFVILLDNAIKYSKEGKSIVISAKNQDGKVITYVKDEGLGIAASDLPHIFDRFYRSDKSRTSQQTNGHGLGLSIAKRIVQVHSGTITAESTLGKETTFIIALPKA